MAKTPQMLPRILLALFDLKNEPCPQSCRMMKMRIRNPAVSTPNASVSQYDTSRLRYMRYHRMRYGPNEVMICETLRRTSETWYGATIFCQDNLRVSGAERSTVELFTCLLLDWAQIHSTIL